ncbi:hypothetical protein [Agriterribacter sp.]|uniref:hypothetical protein n=1 Tax=Agriterribacter sp. TaxID=2821509 RepID=UPI002C1A7653|nr:hypothetical protein [Agriterribacter sp.]HRO46695.1 hypothetical protein [Agriterribacter sp.]HRQ16965.1 hypothetical protein [Agriterribacter sp.]
MLIEKVSDKDSIPLSGITSYCKETGIAEVFVQADEADGYALYFYHSTGGIHEKVVHFVYPLNR